MKRKIIVILSLMFVAVVALFATTTETKTATVVNVDKNIIYISTDSDVYSFYNDTNNFINGDELTVTFYKGFTNNPEKYTIINIK